MDNNEITIMNLNNMISEFSSEFLFSKTKQHHSYFCSSLAKIKKAYLKASLNDDRELMKILSSNYWEVKTIQILSQQKKLIREAKSYSRQWWSIAHNATKRSWIYRAHKWLLTNGKQKIFEEIKVKHLKNARPTNEAFINRSSLIKNLSLNEEDFELNKYDLANAWPRLAKLSNDGSSPSAACLKLLNFESRIMIGLPYYRRGKTLGLNDIQWENLFKTFAISGFFFGGIRPPEDRDQFYNKCVNFIERKNFASERLLLKITDIFIGRILPLL
ncbi:hypothetical protein GJ496_005574 [Pomphorhynchus laevis]|nr:hypothetical protein GJ496_005574 [Pomphorhynchus laevis]